MENLIDLHVHTTASDGELSSKQVVEKAKEIGLSAISIVDHDNVNAIGSGRSWGKRLGIEVVPGLELTTYWREQNLREFHILGYFINYHSSLLLNTLAHFQKVRENRAYKMLEILESLGFVVDYDYLKKIAVGSIGRPHVARTVIENKKNWQKLREIFGKIPNFSEFIVEYIIPGKVAFVEKEGLEPKEAIGLIKKVGGLSVLAHPGYDVAFEEEKLLEQFAHWGLSGLEAIAPIGDKENTLQCIDFFSDQAKRLGLLITGGSDFHYEGKPEAGMGLLKWGIKIPYSLLERLRMLKSNYDLG